MAATQYLTERGHEVVLYEKAGKLGGRMFEASALSFKDGFRRYFEYTVRKTIGSGARIVLGTEVNKDTIRVEAPDVLVIAVGGKPVVPADVKGLCGPNVMDVSAVDRGEAETGAKVVVCGAGLSGTECALSLAMEGKQVTLVDMLPADMFYSEIAHFAKPTIERLLSENKVKVMAQCTVLEIKAEGVVIRNATGKTVTLKCDTAVAAFGVEPDAGLVAELREIVPETYVIGDADKTGQIGDAIASAFWLTREV
jgi:NADPH-dependent 2,4-dienoyl-CoA reductase/sulfur reductase-like enzyme